jgi:hypothetical protein
VKQVPYVRAKLDDEPPPPAGDLKEESLWDKLAKLGVALWGKLAKLGVGLCAALVATFYGAIPAALAFGFLASVLHVLVRGEIIVAVAFTAIYALIASLPIYKVLLDQNLRQYLGYELLKWCAIGLTGLAALVSIGFNHLSPPELSLYLSAGFWVLNAKVVGFLAFLPMAITAGWVAAEAAGEGPFVHEGFWLLYNNELGDGQPLQKPLAARVSSRIRFRVSWHVVRIPFPLNIYLALVRSIEGRIRHQPASSTFQVGRAT